MKKILISGIIIATFCWAIGLNVFTPEVKAASFSSGDLIKGPLDTVYYFGADGYRYVFPNEKIYKTWYADFSRVKTITASELQAIQIKPQTGNVTYKPGLKLVKITTDPKVYAVAANGALRWISAAQIAANLYGANWQNMIDDLADSFFANYIFGAPINSELDFNPQATAALAVSINADKGLGQAIVENVLNVSLAADTPAAANLASGATANFTKIIFNVPSQPVSIKSIKVRRYGISSNSDLTNIKLVDATGATFGSVASLDANSKAAITFTPSLAINTNSPITLFIRASIVSTAPSGNTIAFGIDSASDIELASGKVAGNFPVVGNYMGGTYTGPNTYDLIPPEGILIGSRTRQGVASFKVSAGAAEDMEIDSVTVTDNGSGKVGVIWYLYAEYRNDNKSVNEPVSQAILDPGAKKAKFILATDTIIVPASKSVSLTVAVDVVAVDGATVQNGDTLQAIIAAGTDIVATGKASGQQVNGSAVTDSKIYYVLKSYPYFSLDTSEPGNILMPQTKALLAVFKITADPADEIDFLSAANNTTGIANKLKVNISHSCTAGIGNGMILQDESGNILDSQAVDVCAANSATFTFGNPSSLQISAGATKKLYIYADTRGATGAGSSLQVYLSDDNAANLDFAINGSGNYQYAQYIFRSNIYGKVLSR